MTPPIYHYTCGHGRRALGEAGTVRALAEWNRGAAKLLDLAGSSAIGTLSWFTDLDVPVVEALGLTRATIYCDRTRYRYRVVEDDLGLVVPWLDSPRRAGWLLNLEHPRGVMPRHWFVATEPVRVVLD
jgi:hypothetical protein